MNLGETVLAAATRPATCPECGSGPDEASARCRTCNGIMTQEQEEHCVNFFLNSWDDLGDLDPLYCLTHDYTGAETLPERVGRAVLDAWDALPSAERLGLLRIEAYDASLRQWLMTVRV